MTILCIYIFLLYLTIIFYFMFRSFFLEHLFMFLLLFCFLSLFFLVENELLNPNKFRYELLCLYGLTFIFIYFLFYSKDLILIYIFLEAYTFTVITILGSRRMFLTAIEAGLKYLIINAIGTLVFLMGMYLLQMKYFNSLYHLQYLIEIDTILPILLIIIAFFIKIAVVPMHNWFADVLEGSSTNALFFLLLISKVPYLWFLLKILLYIDTVTILFYCFCMAISLLTLLIGAIAAMEQFNIKRFLAYSSINHTGYILFGLFLFSETGSHCAIYYLFCYMLATIAFFSVYVSVQNTIRKRHMPALTLFSLTNFFSTHSVLTSCALVFSLFSFLGLPPFAGFFGKLYLFYASIQLETLGLTILFLLGSVYSAIYYIRILKISLFRPQNVGFEWKLGFSFFQNGTITVRIIQSGMIILLSFFLLLAEPIYLIISSFN